MTVNYTPDIHITSNYSSCFGGFIYNGDYDNYHSLKDIASRIASDLRFDERCRKNELFRNRKNETNN